MTESSPQADPLEWWDKSRRAAEDEVLARPDLPWDYEGLSANPNTTLRLVDAMPDAPWDYGLLGSMPTLKLEDVRARFGRGWLIGLTDHINMQALLCQPQLPWDWHGVSRSPHLDIAAVAQDPSLPWDWDEINCNPAVTLRHVHAFPHLPWNPEMLLVKRVSPGLKRGVCQRRASCAPPRDHTYGVEDPVVNRG